MNLTNTRPPPLTKTSKPSTEGAFFASWLVMPIFHTKLSAGRRARSAPRTRAGASSARALETSTSVRATVSASLHMPEGLHDVQARGAPGGIEPGQRGPDDREPESLRPHRAGDE